MTKNALHPGRDTATTFERCSEVDDRNAYSPCEPACGCLLVDHPMEPSPSAACGSTGFLLRQGRAKAVPYYLLDGPVLVRCKVKTFFPEQLYACVDDLNIIKNAPAILDFIQGLL